MNGDNEKAGASAMTSGGGEADKGDKGGTVQTSGSGAAELTPEQKAAAAALEAPVDEKWAPKLGEGHKLDDTTLGEFRGFAKERKLNAGLAQSLVEFDLKRQERFVKELEASVASDRKAMRESLKTDKDFGGAKYDESMRHVQRAVAKYGDPELAKFLDAGAGDNPALVKAWARIGKDLAEDKVAPVTTKTAPPSGEKAELQKLFDKSPELFA